MRCDPRLLSDYVENWSVRGCPPLTGLGSDAEDGPAHRVTRAGEPVGAGAAVRPGGDRAGGLRIGPVVPRYKLPAHGLDRMLHVAFSCLDTAGRAVAASYTWPANGEIDGIPYSGDSGTMQCEPAQIPQRPPIASSAAARAGTINRQQAGISCRELKASWVVAVGLNTGAGGGYQMLACVRGPGHRPGHQGRPRHGELAAAGPEPGQPTGRCHRAGIGAAHRSGWARPTAAHPSAGGALRVELGPVREYDDPGRRLSATERNIRPGHMGIPNARRSASIDSRSVS